MKNVTEKKSKTTLTNQGRAFKEAARKIGADSSEASFDAALKKLATAKPKKK